MVFNEKGVYVLPKITYIHSVGVQGSLMERVAKSGNDEKVQKLIELARTECEYKDERELEIKLEL
jgi:hypothetical protein